MNKDETKIDILEMMDQSIDAWINKDLIAAAEQQENGETCVAMIKLFNEYGIYGRKCLDLINRLGALFAITDFLEGGTDNDNT